MAESAERLRVFIDVNVLVAGARSTTGASHLILRLGELGVIRLISCEQVRNEAQRAIVRLLPAAAAALSVIADASCEWIADASKTERDRLKAHAHEKDVAILASAISAQCHTLVTHNVRDFKAPKGSIIVETPGAFIERFRALLIDLAAGS